MDHFDAENPAANAGPGFLTILWRRKALVFFGLTIGLIAGVLFYLQKPPTYQSLARLVVIKRRADPLPMSSNSSSGTERYVEDWVSTQEAIIKSHIVWKRAEVKLKSDTLRMPPPANEYLGFLERGLKVQRDKDANSGTANNVLNIAFQSGSPEDCQTVVNAVIESYRDSLNNIVSTVTEDSFSLIIKGRNDAERDLLKAEQDYEDNSNAIRSQNVLTIADLKNQININETQKNALEQECIKLKAERGLIEKGIASGQNREDIARIFQISSRGREILPEIPRTPEDTRLQLDIHMAELLEKVGKDHPDVISLRKRTEKINDYLNRVYKRSATDEDKPPPEPVQLFLDYLKMREQSAEQQMTALQLKLNDAREAVQKLDRYVVKEQLIRSRIERSRQNLQNFEERKKQLELTRDAPMFDATLITPAGPGGKVSPILITTLALSGVLGLVLGSGLAYLAEVSDKSFRSIEEVRQRLGLTVIGQVPALAGYEPSVIEQNPLDPMLIVHHSPKSIQAEAYRGVRTSLYFSTRGKGHQVIQVTSPNPGDGKSTLTSNLAAAIAQSGRKVILIDADFRKPRVHKIFGLGNAEVGLASVIAGEAELESAIYSCEVPGLSILPCGPRPTNPADLLTSSLFSEIIDEIKKDYDFVLIDTPPLLAVSDPSVVAPRVDGVILTIRMGKNSRPMAEQARERLAILNANVLGVVVNGLDETNSMGGYGYGYSYGYSYAYTYGEESESSTNLNNNKKSR